MNLGALADIVSCSRGPPLLFPPPPPPAQDRRKLSRARELARADAEIKAARKVVKEKAAKEAD